MIPLYYQPPIVGLQEMLTVQYCNKCTWLVVYFIFLSIVTSTSFHLASITYKCALPHSQSEVCKNKKNPLKKYRTRLKFTNRKKAIEKSFFLFSHLTFENRNVAISSFCLKLEVRDPMHTCPTLCDWIWRDPEVKFDSETWTRHHCLVHLPR